MYDCPGRFGGSGKGKGVREGLGAAGVDRADLSFSFAFRLYVGRKLVAVRNTQVIEILLDLLMIITGQRDLEVWIGRLDYLYCLTHCLHRALVHRDGGLLKPALLFQVTGEVFQERAPIFRIGWFSRFGVDKLDSVGRLVVIIE